jgi:muconolactone D-isomerase
VLFHVRITVSLPADLDFVARAELIADEERYSGKLREDGTWRHLWRVAGHHASIAVFDVESAEALNDILWNHPLFPFLTLDVTPLAAHPSADGGGKPSTSHPER